MTDIIKTNNYTGPDRRQYKRIRQHFIVRFKKPGMPWQMVTAQNLSAGGVLFNFNDKLDKDTTIDLKINFPLIKEPISCSGITVRADQPSAGPVFKIAVKFLDIVSGEKSTINKSADEFYSKKPGKIEP